MYVSSTVPSLEIDVENTDVTEYDESNYDDDDEDMNEPKITSSSSLATQKPTTLV